MGKILQVDEDNVRKAAETCSVAEEVLMKLFPESFAMGFTSGSIFFCPSSFELRKQIPKSFEEAVYDGQLSRCWILCHINSSPCHSYMLFNMSTGYRFFPELTGKDGTRYFFRGKRGIEIPFQILRDFVLIKKGDGSGEGQESK